MIDRRGVIRFLVITFGVTYALDVVVIAMSRRWPLAFQAGVAVSMFVPGLTALLVRKLWRSPDDPGLGLRLGRLKYYGWVWLIVPALFAGTYAVTWLTGIGRFDPSLTYVFQLMETFRVPVNQSGMEVLNDPRYLWAILGLSLLWAPFINSVAAFGEELGWRGFLWPRLAPMGFWRASGLSGVIWGLWHAPIILWGFNYPRAPLLGVIWMCVLTTILGTWINWLKERTGSTLLASWVHGVFNSQAYGIWRILTWPVNELIGGMTGLVGFAFLALPTVWLAATGRIARVDPRADEPPGPGPAGEPSGPADPAPAPSGTTTL
jgi:membrane protease YdiL (CAAX protease family)